MALSKIMVVIDPTQDQHPEFDRAVQSASMTGAKLHLYLCINREAGAEADEPDEVARQRLSSQFQEKLDDLQRLAADQQIEAATELEWVDDWRHQVVKAAARCSADMIFKYSHHHNVAQREKRETSDYALLRLSPCPVLLVKAFTDWQHRRVLGAINYASSDAAHIKLNNRVVRFALQFAIDYGSEAHFVNAYQDLYHVPEQAQVAQIFGVPADHVHLCHGTAAEVIGKTAEELEVDLIIIGTVARSGLQGTVLGNTAEKILDQTHSDLLVLN